MTKEEKEKLYKRLESKFINSTGLAGERYKLGLDCYLQGVRDTLIML